MTKYREIMKMHGPVLSEVQTTESPIDSIAQHLGLGTLAFNVAPATNQGIMMTWQEYDRYISAERDHTDPLIFWGASLFLCE